MTVTLCEECRNSIVTRFSNGSMLVRCSYITPAVVIAKVVTTCSEFDDKKNTDRYEMEKIAWRLTTDKKANSMGFKPPKRHDD